MRDVLGRGLGALGLFPHRAMFDEPARVERHLERNRHMAQGRNPAGRQVPDDYVLRRIEQVDIWSRWSPIVNSDLEALRDRMRRFAEHLFDGGAACPRLRPVGEAVRQRGKEAGFGARIGAILSVTRANSCRCSTIWQSRARSTRATMRPRSRFSTQRPSTATR